MFHRNETLINCSFWDTYYLNYGTTSTDNHIEIHKRSKSTAMDCSTGISQSIVPWSFRKKSRFNGFIGSINFPHMKMSNTNWFWNWDDYSYSWINQDTLDELLMSTEDNYIIGGCHSITDIIQLISERGSVPINNQHDTKYFDFLDLLDFSKSCYSIKIIQL